MTKQSKIFGMLAIVGLSAMMMISCGGGSGSVKSGKTIARNDVLGDLPNLVYQHRYVDSVYSAQRSAEKEKIMTDKNGAEKYEKIKAKYKALDDAEDAKFEAELEKIKLELIGKDVPFEVEEGTGYEILSCKIVLVDGSGVSAEFEVKVTDVDVVSPYKSLFSKTMTVVCTVQDIDKNGNQIGSNGAIYLDFPARENGAIAKKTTRIFANEVDFAKIKFIKEK